MSQVFRIARERIHIKSKKRTFEIALGLTNLDAKRADAAQLLAYNRGHWAIENKLHWVRDVTFDEDRSQVRTGQTPQAMACIRNIALNLLRLAGAVFVPEACRHLDKNVHEALRLIGL